MELLLVNNAEVQKGSGVNSTFDGSLTDLGIKQVCSTSAWLNYHFKLDDFVGFSSPYMKTLQMASILSEVIRIDFEVNQLLREFTYPVQPLIQITNRSIPFQNLNWPVAQWTEKSNFYPEETIDNAIDRIDKFYRGLIDGELGKVILISHPIPIIILGELAIGKSVEYIKGKMSDSPSPDDSLDQLAMHQMLNGMRDCGITWIENDEIKWFSKTVF